MNNPEVVLNMEDIYYKYDDNTRKLLDNNSKFCYRFFTSLFSCFF